MNRVKILILIISIINFVIFPFYPVQIISIFIILSFILSFIYSRILFVNISVSMDKDVYYCKNSKDEFTGFKVINRGYLPLDNIFIHVRGNGCFNNNEGEFLDSIQSRGINSFSSKIITGFRGVHKIGPIIIKGSDPFHFFPWTKQFEVYSDVVIYPRYHDIELLLINGERGGLQHVKNPLYEDLSNLKSIREFRPGDSLKRVNWKATAKVGALQTMEFSNSLSAPLFVLMDIDPIKYPIKKRYIYLERAIEVTSSLITSYSLRGEGTGLITKDRTGVILIPQGRGYAHTVSHLDNLARIEFCNKQEETESIIETFFNNRVLLPTGSHIYILLPEINEKIIKDLNLFKKGKYNIKLVNTGGKTTPYNSSNYEMLTLSSYGEEFFI